MRNILSKFLLAFSVVALVLSALPVSSVRAADTGFQNPTGCTTNVATQWITPGNATADDGAYTTSNAINEVLICSFNLPVIPAGNTITNIEVEFNGFASGTRESAVDLSWSAFVPAANNTADTNTAFTNTGIESTFTLSPGAGTNTPWGRTWAVGDFTAANFRVRLTSNGGTNVISLDQIRIRVTYEPNVTITVTQGANGNITPAGPAVSVPYLGDQAFSITPNTSFIVNDVTVDGGSVGRLNAYTFNNVITNTHTITASFDGGWSQPSSNVNSGWTTPANGYVSDNAFAVANATTDIVNYCGFNLGIPANSTVDGIEVAIEGYATGSREAQVSLSWDGGTSQTTTTNTTSMPNGGSEATYILGSPSDDWGRLWADSDLTNANFCVELDATFATGDLNIDQVQVTVTYHPAVFYTITASAGTGGTITPSGALVLQDTSDQFFDSTPNATYILSDVVVDAVSAGRANAYTFTNILADHTIVANFNGGWAAPSANTVTGVWLNPANVYVSDNAYASSIILNGVTTLSGVNFVPAIPAGATIEGIEIAIEGYATGTKEINVSLSWDGGTTFTAAQSTSFVNDGPEVTLVLGGPTNTWGRTWTGSEFSNFRIRLTSPFAIGTVFVDQVQVKVYYDDVPPDTTITVSPTNPSNDTTPDFEFTGTDDVGGSGIAGFECQMDGGGFSACTTPANFGPLTDGSHTFEVRAIDNAGNVDPTPASYTWLIDATAPDTSITSNPTNPSGDPNPTFTFTGDDGTGSGVASFECQIDGGGFSSCNSGDSFGPLSAGSHTFEVRAIDNAGNIDLTPATYTWTINLTGPSVNIVNSIIDTGDGVLAEYEIVSVNITGLVVQFSEDVYNPAGDSDPDDVTNPNNYLLVRDYGDTTGFQTIDCITGADEPEDTRINVDSVTYNNATFTATLSINGGLPLSNGTYRLFVCGTTSITNLLGVSLNFNGTTGLDFTRNFLINIPRGGGGGVVGGVGSGQSTLGSLIPNTGFAPLEVTTLAVQPLDQMYTQTGLRLEIPNLSININIVGVNRSGLSWDVKWLGSNAGYLEGSAYPTWSGNTVLTGHVADASNIPGPFAYLKELRDGDKVYIHSNGLVYVYEVQQSFTVSPNNVAEVFKHQEYNWITLVTCENYNENLDTYTSRRVVRAILISVFEKE